MRSTLIIFYGAISIISPTLSGCSTPQIPSDQLKNFALVIPQDIYGTGSAITEVDSGPQRSRVLQTTEGPGMLPGVSTRRGANISAGKHSIQVTTCRNSDTRSCRPDVYIFEAKPGLAYILRGPDRTIDVLDRFQKSPMGRLHPVENYEFVSDQVFSDIQISKKKKETDLALAVVEQRRNDQALIRKVGAKVCQKLGRGMIYVGYVEKIVGEKVQIRISDAHLNGDPTIRPGGFKPSIIWDSPMNWDLCE
ncbi:hypothetical protein D3C87_866450 [compost metagenome]